jgi:hypothetical protein
MTNFIRDLGGTVNTIETGNVVCNALEQILLSMRNKDAESDS